MTDEQERRAEALRAARNVSPNGDAMDLVNLASWITTGVDPWLPKVTGAQKRATS